MENTLVSFLYGFCSKYTWSVVILLDLTSSKQSKLFRLQMIKLKMSKLKLK